MEVLHQTPLLIPELDLVTNANPLCFGSAGAPTDNTPHNDSQHSAPTMIPSLGLGPPKADPKQRTVGLGHPRYTQTPIGAQISDWLAGKSQDAKAPFYAIRFAIGNCSQIAQIIAA